MRKAQRLDFAIAWTALCLTPALACAAPAPVHHVALPADPLGSPMWAYHAARLLSDAPVVFDPRVRLILPTIAENQHQFPVTVDARSIPGVQRILVYADLNPLTLAVDYRPLHAEPFLSLRIKLDQRTPVRAAVLAADGKWHVGSAWVDAAGGGCSAPPVGRVKSAVRRLLGRDWYPDTSEVDVQAGVVGRPAMICALAWGGRMVGSFAGETLRTISATGPSTEVRIGPHPAMSEASGRMIAALGCTGWIGFDFMIEAATGAPVLIECNPRPIQIGHLGYRIGVDLSAALAALLRGGAVPDVPLAARETLDILLFPHALDPMALRAGVLADMPMTDAGLMRYGAGLARGAGA